jgi:RNA-binding protein YlmH
MFSALWLFLSRLKNFKGESHNHVLTNFCFKKNYSIVMHVLKTFDNACTPYGGYLSIRLALLLLYKKMFRPFQQSVKVRVIS